MTLDQDVLFKLALNGVTVKVAHITYDCIELDINGLAIRFKVERTHLKNESPASIKMFIPTGTGGK